MNKTTKWLVGLVAALVVINIALVATIWLKKDEAKRPPQGGDARDYLVQSLDMSDAQVKTFDSLRKEHFEQVRQQKETLRFIKDRLFAMLSDTAKNEIKDRMASYLTDKIGEVQEKIDKETFDHFLLLRSLLNAQQQEKFDTTIQQVLRTMEPRAPRPGGPPPDGEPLH